MRRQRQLRDLSRLGPRRVRVAGRCTRRDGGGPPRDGRLRAPPGQPALLSDPRHRGDGRAHRRHPPGAALSAGALIVGAGQAGVQVAVSLRELGYEAPIVLVGAESRPPYQRPPLSKAFLLGKAEEGSLAFRTATFYDDRGIEVLGGERIREATLPSAATPGSATTASGRCVSFDHLALT